MGTQTEICSITHNKNTVDKSRETSGISLKSHIPPIVSILPQLAIGKYEIRKHPNWRDRFEQRIPAAFKLVGFESKILGRAAGLTILSGQNHSAIMIDAKVGSDECSLGVSPRGLPSLILFSFQQTD